MADAEQKEFECVIWGGYGWGNTGDELCLEAALDEAQQKFGGKVAVLSHNPEYTAWLFPKATVLPYVAPRSQVPRQHFKREREIDSRAEWERALFRARRLYLAGGGYLTDLFPLESILPPIELASQLQLPVVTAPLGLGPFKSGAWADKVAAILQGMDLKVRDEVSHAFCKTRGIPAVLEPDAAFSAVRYKSMPAATPRTSPRKIGVCIFAQYGQAPENDLSGWWIECLIGLRVRHPEFQLEGFCFHTSPSAEFYQMIHLFQRAGLPVHQVRAPEMDFRKATTALHQYDLIISTRFHAVVMANVFKIPNLAIASGDYYQAKMNAATRGHEPFSSLMSPAKQPPEIFLEDCARKLARSENH